MQHDVLKGLIAPQTWMESVPSAWRVPLLWLAAIWTALVVLFRADWLAMADQWWNSSTYNHVLLIPGILVWLIWLRVRQLALLVPSAWWPGVAAFGGAAFLWVLGDFSGLSIARQLGAVAMLVAAVMATLGPRVSAGLLFPLAYMFFLVPFGDELVPPLQMITAFLTVRLVEISGIPAVIDGVFIHTPAGLFEVAEACSGVKFLIAMIAFGVLAANVCFRSWGRRVAFVVLCIVVPVLANGLRAWGTVFVAQYVGAERASGFDHIIYGWVFFAVVIAVVIALAWRYFDRDIDDQMIDAGVLESSPLLARLAGMSLSWPAAAAMLTATGMLALAWSGAASSLSAPLPRQIDLPKVQGWQRVAYHPETVWEPRAQGAEHRLLGRFRDKNGRTVDVFFALYSGQGEGREAGGFGQGAMPEGGDWAWSGPGAALAEGSSVRLLAQGKTRRAAVTFYRTGSMVTGSNLKLRMANMSDRLLLRARPTMMLILSSEAPDDQAADAALTSFAQAAGPLAPWMDQLAGLR